MRFLQVCVAYVLEARLHLSCFILQLRLAYLPPDLHLWLTCESELGLQFAHLLLHFAQSNLELHPRQ